MDSRAAAAPESLTTDRLLLVRPRREDAGAIFNRYSSDPNVTRYLGWPRHQSVSDAEAFITFSDEEWTRGGCGPYLISLRANRELLGGTGLHRRDGGNAETGYVLAADSWGRGYATEALRAMILVAEQIGIGRVFATCHVDHRASARVLEKCGFALERLLTDQTFPNLVPANAPALRYSRAV
jgi:RimJ/RimL family protein N-acetyltransferase